MKWSGNSTSELHGGMDFLPLNAVKFEIGEGVSGLSLSRSDYLQRRQLNTLAVLLFHSIPAAMGGFGFVYTLGFPS